MKLPRPRLTYANVVSTLCLFILLGGGAYAATQLPRNSVGSAQIRKHAVTPAKLSASVKRALHGAPGATAGGGGLPEAFVTGNFPEAPPQVAKSEKFTLASAGSPFVFASGLFRAYCPVNEGSKIEVGLFVDGKPANGDVEQMPTGTMTTLSLFGLGSRVAAGKHTVSIGFSCENGSIADLETGPNGAAIGGFLVER